MSDMTETHSGPESTAQRHDPAAGVTHRVRFRDYLWFALALLLLVAFKAVRHT